MFGFLKLLLFKVKLKFYLLKSFITSQQKNQILWSGTARTAKKELKKAMLVIHATINKLIGHAQLAMFVIQKETQ